MEFVNWAIARLKEPSTYAGLGVLLAAAHISLSADMQSAIIGVCVALAGLASVLLKEKTK